MVQANLNRPLVPTFGLKLNGKPMAMEMEPWVTSISVHEEINLPGAFQLQLGSRDPADRAVPWIDDERLRLGAQIELSLGYGAQLDTVIVGEITDLEPAFSRSGPPRLVVGGQDLRHRLNGRPNVESFGTEDARIKDGEIIAKILDRAGLSISAEDADTRVGHSSRFQNYETDLAFVQRLAAGIGYELVMEGAKLRLRPRANDGAVAATLTFDDDLFEFDPHMTLLPWTDVQMRGWNPETKDEFRAFADAERLIGQMGKTPGTKHIGTILNKQTVDLLVPVPVSSQAELDQLVAARFNAAALDYIRGGGSCRGRTDVRAGNIIRIDKIGKTFSGPYYVTAVAHSYSTSDGYTTSFEVRRNAS